MIRTIISGALIFALLQTSRTSDVLSGLTRPAVLAVSALFGGEMSDQGGILLIGNLRVPWTRDCAGFDVLLVLWGLILWTSRHEPIARRFWWRMISAVPAAVLANILRVFTIIAWRKFFYPAVESPQAHYFIGFLWLLPLLFLFVPRRGMRIAPWLAVLAMPAAVLSLVAPQASAPGGMLVSAAAILLLAMQDYHRPEFLWQKIFASLWIVAAILLAGTSMESLWLPWLLACPWFIPRNAWLRGCAVLLPVTVPLFAMSSPWICCALLGVSVCLLFRFHAKVQERISSTLVPGFLTTIFLGFLLLLPFFASSLGPALRAEIRPPRGIMARRFEADCWQLQLAMQSPHVYLSWVAPSGTGRHHTLPVCMSYRGRKLHNEKNYPNVFRDNEYWLSESFLMPDGELCDYPGYLRNTLVPFSNPGIHLIASSPIEAMDSDRFNQLSQTYFAKVAASYRRIQNPNPQ